jgi:acetyl-CoA acyltransferase
MSKVYIVGIGMTPLGKHLNMSVKHLTAVATNAALADAGCSIEEIDAAWFSNTRQGVMEGQHGIRGQCALRAMGFESIPIINCDNACASSSTGLNQAYASVRAGLCEVALVVGAEKMHYPDKRELMFEAFRGGMDRELAERQVRDLIAAADIAGTSISPDAAHQHSIFMDSYAAMARHHMKLFGTTREQLAIVASKSHQNSQFNPNAQYQHAMTVEEVLADRMVSWPLTRSMCAPVTDGAAALVLCAESAVTRFDRSRAVTILATQLASGVRRHVDDLANHVGRIAANKAYEQAGVGPNDLSFVEVHDATSFAELRHVENLGLCEIGAAGFLAESGATQLDGRIPVNPSGGLVSKGHPIGATGAIQLHELVVQLRGEAGRRQVPNARIAAAENGGGFYDGEEAVAVTTILARP